VATEDMESMVLATEFTETTENLATKAPRHEKYIKNSR
jgi:hypothetical protein